MDMPENLPPGIYGVGTSLDWKSNAVEVVFAVELPFRLLMPSCRLSVDHCGVTVDVAIENNGIEIQRGRQYSATQRNTVFIGSESAAHNARVPAMGLPGGGIFRGTKTLIYLTAYPMADACKALFEEQGPRYQDGYRYFASLANGHMGVLNHVVNAYRRASVDPYASEVTKWDVPNWFVLVPGKEGTDDLECAVVSLYAALVEDWYPTIRAGIDGELLPYYAASEECVVKQLQSTPTPGEIDLLDGWSLFHGGRFADSIRSFVTAIEVLIESEVRRHLEGLGCSEHVIQGQLDATRSNFDSRIEQYCKLTGQRLPGPRPCGIPYLNGIRLHDELNATRKLRHKIVHHGHRLDESFRGPMLRAAETTSWFFDWIAEGSGFEDRRRATHVYFFGQRTSGTPFSTDIDGGCIKVIPPFRMEDLPSTAPAEEENGERADHPLVIEDMLRVVHCPSILLTAIGNDHHSRDIEHFVRMALYELGLGEVADSPYPVAIDCVQDRYIFRHGAESVAVYCLESSRRLDISDLHRVVEGIVEQRAWGRAFDHYLVIYDDQYSTEPHCRIADACGDIGKLAESRRITLVNASELAGLILGVLDYRWCHEAIVDSLFAFGYADCIPPNSVAIGWTYRFWDERQVVGIQLEEGVFLDGSERISFRVKHCWKEIPTDGFRVDDQNRLTLACVMPSRKFLPGRMVYKLDATTSYSTKYRYQPPTDGATESVMAAKVMHPSEDGTR